MLSCSYLFLIILLFSCYMTSNLIKILILTCSPLLICRGVGDMKKLYYWLHVSDPMS